MLHGMGGNIEHFSPYQGACLALLWRENVLQCFSALSGVSYSCPGCVQASLWVRKVWNEKVLKVFSVDFFPLPKGNINTWISQFSCATHESDWDNLHSHLF